MKFKLLESLPTGRGMRSAIVGVLALAAAGAMPDQAQAGEWTDDAGKICKDEKLWRAVDDMKPIEEIRAILDAGANPDGCFLGVPVVHQAADECYTEALKELHQRGAKLNVSFGGDSALYRTQVSKRQICRTTQQYLEDNL